MSDVFDALPWYTRWRTHVFFVMPKWYQRWHHKKKFRQRVNEGLEGTEPRENLIRALACAELLHRLGDDSLMDIVTEGDK